HKLWPSTHLRDRLGGRQKGMWGRKDSVAPLDASGGERKAKRVSPAAYTNTIRRATKRSKVGLELLDHWSAPKPPVPQGRLEDMQQLFLELPVWRHQINKWDHVSAFHLVVLVSSLINGRFSRASSAIYQLPPAVGQPADQQPHRSAAFYC